MDRRDRHGRGMRGPLARPPVPLAFTRREEFEDLVVAAAERLDAHLLLNHGTSLDAVEFAVEDMPFFSPADEPDVVPFGRIDEAAPPASAVIVLYRRTIELRTEPGDERAELVHDALVELVADLLGLDADEIDPGYDD